MTAIVLYIPAIHAGYVKLLRSVAAQVDTVFVLGNQYIDDVIGLHREIRALQPSDAVRAIEGMLPELRRVTELIPGNLYQLKDQVVTTSDDEVGRRFAVKYLTDSFVRYESVFLRWDEANVFKTEPPEADRVSHGVADRNFISIARQAGHASSDWWRRIGALAVRDGQELFSAFNKHVPTEHTQYIEGDPRDVVPAGTVSEINTVLHAEQGIVVQAAKVGLSLVGADLYTPTFPCPMCAKMIAFAGFRRLFFAEGHSSLDGLEVLRSQGIEIIHVQ